MSNWTIFNIGDQVMIRENSRRGFDSDFGMSAFFGQPKKTHPGTGIFIVEKAFFHDEETVRIEGCHPQYLVVSQGDFVSQCCSGCIFTKILPPGEDEALPEPDPPNSTPVVSPPDNGIFVKRKSRRMPAFFYRFDHCGAFRAFLRPNFRRSFTRGSRLRNPAFFIVPRSSALCSMIARASPSLIASA